MPGVGDVAIYDLKVTKGTQTVKRYRGDSAHFVQCGLEHFFVERQTISLGGAPQVQDQEVSTNDLWTDADVKQGYQQLRPGRWRDSDDHGTCWNL